MKITWPPSDQSGWQIEPKTQKKDNNKIFFPFFRHDQVLLAIRVKGEQTNFAAKAWLQQQKYLEFTVNTNEWTALPYPVESHAADTFWSHIELESEVEINSYEWGFYSWNERLFRMRALITLDNILLAAYRINKNGQVISFIPIKDEQMTFTEDALLLPKVENINRQSILLQSAKTKIQTKKPKECTWQLHKQQTNQESADSA